jgi:hypothetical protein
MPLSHSLTISLHTLCFTPLTPWVSPPYPLCEWYPQSMEILSNVGVKWWNSAFNAQGSRVTIVIVQVGTSEKIWLVYFLDDHHFGYNITQSLKEKPACDGKGNYAYVWTKVKEQFWSSFVGLRAQLKVISMSGRVLQLGSLVSRRSPILFV